MDTTMRRDGVEGMSGGEPWGPRLATLRAGVMGASTLGDSEGRRAMAGPLTCRVEVVCVWGGGEGGCHEGA